MDSIDPQTTYHDKQWTADGNARHQPITSSPQTTLVDDLIDPALPAGTTTRPMVFEPPRTPPSGVKPLGTLFGGRLGRDLDLVEIAHDRTAQALFDTLDIPWGVQYEIARGVLNGEWDWAAVTRDRLLQLRASDEQCAPRARDVLLGRDGRGRPPTLARVAAFRELDLEQKALLEGRGRGLGLMGPWEEEGLAEDWFGGKIQQVLRLSRASSSQGGLPFEFRLQPMEQRRSYRLARRLGSRRILQVRFEKEFGDPAKEGEGGVAEFLARSKFVLCGRVYVPFASKDGSAYMVEVDEDYQRRAREACGDQYRLSLEELIESENPWVMNSNQPITKWVTRFSLSFSTSIPAVEFDEENMFLIEDEYATGWDRSSGSPPAEQIMTDGCGFINRTALTQIAKRFKLAHGMPTAIQGRIAGAKGMWMLHPYDDDDAPRIWIRASQNKIKLPRLERWHRILDLLKFAQPPTASGFDLSEQAVLNLAHNGVPDSAFETLTADGLRARTEPFLNWDLHPAALWKAVSDIGNVTGSRRVRGSQVFHRLVSAYRQTGADADVLGGVEDAEVDEQLEAMTMGRDPYSGAPRAMHEVACELIQAGFRPQTNDALRDKLEKILEMTCQAAVEEYRVPVPDSRGMNAFVVPDPLGVLKEGEIFYKASESFLDPQTSTLVSYIEGEVIVGRYPIRLPSDVRKVTAVNIAALHKFTDVIIVPTVGERSLVSLLSGGDCDGDILFLLRGIFAKDFTNCSYSEPTRDFMERNFEKERETIADFCARVGSTQRLHDPASAAGEKQAALARVFLAELGDSKVGLYSVYHDKAIAKLGYGAPETLRIAHMFNTLLDAKKTGVRVKPDVAAADSAQFGGPPVSDKEKPHVLRALRGAACHTKGQIMGEFARMGEEWARKIERALAVPNADRDQDLLAPRARVARILSREVAIVDAHVKAIYPLWLSKWRRPPGWMPEHVERSAPRKKKGKGEKKDDMLEVTKAFWAICDDNEGQSEDACGDADGLSVLRATGALPAVLASCAYTAHQSGYFPYSVAFRELCRIKAQAVGDLPCIRAVDEVKTIPASAMPYLGLEDAEAW